MHSAQAEDAYILTLDDYHVIETKQIHESLDYLLDHLPPQLHVVIASREAPLLSLPRRRGQGVLTEIQTADLRFTGEEATAFLAGVTGLDLSAQDVAVLQERTEGWPVGLQMAALSLQGREDFVAAFAGDDRYVGDYLLEEVLQRQPPHLQSFLLQTSILERLNGSLCDAVVGEMRDSQAILERLDSSNLFIVPLDNRRHWYRYHRLFADLLHSRLEKEVGAQGLVALHKRASACYESQGLIDDAIRHAIASTDWQRAATLIERLGLAVLGWGVGGFMNVFYNGPLSALFQATIQPEIQGRVFAVQQSLVSIGWPLSLAVAGPVADLVGLSAWYVAGGLVAVLAGLFALSRPTIVNLEQA